MRCDLPDQVVFDIHPDAKRNFDEKASLLATSLTPDPQLFDDSQSFPIAPHVPEATGNDKIVAESNV